MRNKHIGSGFDEFLAEEGLDAQANAIAIKRVIAWQLEQARKRRKINKADMAKRMGTSRAQLDRVLDAESRALTLDTLTKAAAAVGKRVKIELIAA
jgi:DNA-binding Xre family transcriptional regulator